VHPPTALCTIEFHTQLLSSTLQHSQWLLSAGTCKVDSPVNNTNAYAFRFHTLGYEGQKKSPRLINKPNGKREDRVTPFTVVQRWSGRWTHVSVGKRCCSQLWDPYLLLWSANQKARKLVPPSEQSSSGLIPLYGVWYFVQLTENWTLQICPEEEKWTCWSYTCKVFGVGIVSEINFVFMPFPFLLRHHDTLFFFEIETSFATSVLVCKYKIGSLEKNKWKLTLFIHEMCDPYANLCLTRIEVKLTIERQIVNSKALSIMIVSWLGISVKHGDFFFAICIGTWFDIGQWI
jgi:hypothetical protein